VKTFAQDAMDGLWETDNDTDEDIDVLPDQCTSCKLEASISNVIRKLCHCRFVSYERSVT